MWASGRCISAKISSFIWILSHLLLYPHPYTTSLFLFLFLSLSLSLSNSFSLFPSLSLSLSLFSPSFSLSLSLSLSPLYASAFPSVLLFLHHDLFLHASTPSFNSLFCSSSSLYLTLPSRPLPLPRPSCPLSSLSPLSDITLIPLTLSWAKK